MQGYLENQFSFLPSKELNMYYCGRRIETIDHSYGPEMREHFLLMYCVQGKATFHGDGGDIRFGSHDLLVMFPNERIHYHADKGSKWTSWWIGVYGPLAAEFIELLGVTPDDPIVHINNSFTMEFIMQNIYETSKEQTLAAKTKCISMIYELFSFLFENGNTVQKESVVEDTINIIRHNYDSALSVGGIAEMLHINPCYLSRVFKERMGLSPKEYILQHKINRAKELLESTDLSVTEIAHSVGIADSLYFSRIFKSKCQVTPSEYRAGFKVLQEDN